MFGFPRLSRLLSCLAAVPLATAVLSAGCTCGSGPYEGDYFDGERPGSMKGVKFVESDKGDPKLIGCADGQREGFADLKKHPRVAGCIGEWDGTKSLRDKPTGKACGDDGQKCAVPADLCAPGWHVCGNAGKAKDITDRASVEDCSNAGPGRFNAAVSHSISEEIDPCPKITAATTLPCFQAGLGAEPVCCGNDCLSGKCKDGVWKGKTMISRGTSEGCGAVTSSSNAGVMCCFDGDDNPVADVKAPAADGGDAKAPAADGGDAKAPAADGGDAKAPAADAKAPAADAKAPAADAKAPAADAKAPAADAKAPAKKAG
ncbi:MAG: hypothetical protein AAGF11_05690 [Myxococcota bacterium]